MLVRHSLALRGYDVIEFESSEQALGWEGTSTSAENPPLAQADLVFLDVNLPGLSGIETIELIHDSPRLRRIPIVMLTAHSEAEVVLKCIRAGASDYLVKPLNYQEVIRRIDKILADPSGALAKTAAVEITWNFQEVLAREIKRSERGEMEMGLLLGAVRRMSNTLEALTASDIDRLWTSPTDDEKDLREVVESFVGTCRQKVREYDTIVPFGSGEFAAVFPTTDREGMVAVARKIHHLFQSESNLPALSRQERWGLLVGTSVYPMDGKDNLSLFSSAESALSDRAPEKASHANTDDVVFPKTLRCIACGHHFTHLKIATRRLKPVGRESDLRLLFDDVDPVFYGAIACSHCGVAALESDSKFLRDLEPPVFGWVYKKTAAGKRPVHPTQTLIPEELAPHLAPPYESWIDEKGEHPRLSSLPESLSRLKETIASASPGESSRFDLKTALSRHLLACETYHLVGASPLRRARLAHRIAWFYRIGHNAEEERRFLSEALDFYLTAYHFEDLADAKLSDLEILYLLGELSFRLGREADAVTIFDHLVRDSRLESKESFRRMVHRRWYEARHEPPPSS